MFGGLLNKGVNLLKKTFSFGGGATVGAGAMALANKVMADNRAYQLKLLEISSRVSAAEIEATAIVRSAQFKTQSEVLQKLIGGLEKVACSLFENPESLRQVIALMTDNAEKERLEAEIKVRKEALEEEKQFLENMRKELPKMMTLNYMCSVTTENLSFFGFCESGKIEIQCGGQKIPINVGRIKLIVRSELQKKILIYMDDDSTCYLVSEDNPFSINFTYSQGSIQVSVDKDFKIITGLKADAASLFVQGMYSFIKEQKKFFSDEELLSEADLFLSAFPGVMNIPTEEKESEEGDCVSDYEKIPINFVRIDINAFMCVHKGFHNKKSYSTRNVFMSDVDLKELSDCDLYLSFADKCGVERKRHGYETLVFDFIVFGELQNLYDLEYSGTKIPVVLESNFPKGISTKGKKILRILKEGRSLKSAMNKNRIFFLHNLVGSLDDDYFEFFALRKKGEGKLDNDDEDTSILFSDSIVDSQPECFDSSGKRVEVVEEVIQLPYFQGKQQEEIVVRDDSECGEIPETTLKIKKYFSKEEWESIRNAYYIISFLEKSLSMIKENRKERIEKKLPYFPPNIIMGKEEVTEDKYYILKLSTRFIEYSEKSLLITGKATQSLRGSYDPLFLSESLLPLMSTPHEILYSGTRDFRDRKRKKKKEPKSLEDIEVPLVTEEDVLENEEVYSVRAIEKLIAKWNGGV